VECVLTDEIVGTTCAGWKLSITPPASSTMANRKLSGTNTRTNDRTVSTQKFPNVVVRVRITPRMNAAASAIPMAADKNWCTTRANI
jgi:hypothetical protein